MVKNTTIFGGLMLFYCGRDVVYECRVEFRRGCFLEGANGFLILDMFVFRGDIVILGSRLRSDIYLEV